MSWKAEAHQLVLQGNYGAVIRLYEQEISTDTTNIENYWYLGLAYLLNSQEIEAQATWFLSLSFVSAHEVDNLTSKLSSILNTEAEHYVQRHQYQQAWLIRYHLKELEPTLCSNLIELVNLTIQLEQFEPQLLQDWQVGSALLNTEENLNIEQLIQFLNRLQKFPSQEALDLIDSCLKFVTHPDKWLQPLLKSALALSEEYGQPHYAVQLMEKLLTFDPTNINTLKYLSHACIRAQQYRRAIDTATYLYELSTTVPNQFISNYQLLRSLALSGSWLEIQPIIERHKTILNQVLELPKSEITLELQQLLIASVGFLAYCQDNLAENRDFHNRVGHLFPERLSTLDSIRDDSLSFRKQNQKLRIGYIAHTLHQHSVGWLSRWLFKYHNHNDFNITVYGINHTEESSFYQLWFKDNVDKTRSCELDAWSTAQQIQADNIDILIDLDSISLNVTYEVMSLKPAPIQLTWLGWDAPGLSTIDYFIADPYVLSDDAQIHYQENILRLPQTYIAVDGFEIGIPSLHRSDLNIPLDAIVFLSAQAGSKRHPLTVALQMQIIKAIPNSILLIKALGDSEVIQDYFINIAQQEGVNPNQLRFFPWVSDEYTHRANLAIADVVLDTYPYNGATTTLETLWMGLPLVTRVGEIFSSRNSYAFLKNLGISEGIAWTDQDYIDWGIRFGMDESLRQKVISSLKKSRQTSPLWNAKQFTWHMEAAYRQIWERYCQQKTG